MMRTLENRKVEGLMMVLNRIIDKHHQGLNSLDDDTFKLFEAAKRIKWATTEEQLESVLQELPERT